MTRLEGVAHEVTGLLRAWRAGDAAAGEELLQRIYIELKKIAVSQLRRERSGHTLQSTDLVHEAYVRLLAQQGVDWRDRAHFFGLAATMMRRVLVDHARARNARKRARDEGEKPITLQSRQGPEVELLDLDRSLTLFAERYPRQTKVVEMRYFVDMEIEEIASCLEISPATVKRDWQFARAWLRSRLAGSSLSEPGKQA
jgi:RNA polymerase sigma factor (TIGR02999 family)